LSGVGLATLFQALAGSRIEVAPQELLDALELYRLGLRAPDHSAVEASEDGGPPATPQPDESPKRPPQSPADEPASADHVVATVVKQGSGVYLPERGPSSTGRDGVSATPVQAPTVPALRDKQELGRALRPLKRTVPSPSRSIVDIAETARRSAMMRLPSPASAPAPERWLDAVLIVDRSGSHPVWEDTIREATALIQSHGAFRCLQTWFLTAGESGAPVLTDRAGVRVPAGAPVPGPRRLVIVFTDGVARYWQGHEIRDLVRCWAARSPVVIAQLLPQRLWSRSGIRPSSVFFHTFEAGYDGKLRFTDYYGDRDTTTHIAVPVVELSENWVGPWARMAAGRGEDGIAGTAWLIERKARPRRTPQGATSCEPPQPAPAPARAMVAAFRETASTTALRLARFLAAAGDELSLPVMRAVQAAVLPDSEPADLAEVYLSGLLEPAPDAADGPQRGRLAFAEGVGGHLRGGMLRDELTDARLRVGQYIAARLGMSFSQLINAYIQPGSQQAAHGVRLASTPMALLTSAMVQFAGYGRDQGGTVAQRARQPGEDRLHVPEPPVFAVTGHPADQDWTDWAEAALTRLGARVRRFGWPPDEPWSDAQFSRLTVLTRRSIGYAARLLSGGVDGRLADAHVLWVPGVNLPAGLYDRATVLYPGDKEASERALQKLVVSAVRAAQPESDDTVRLFRTTAAALDPPPAPFPGAAEFTHNLIRPRRSYFIGRTRELSAVHDALHAHSGRGVPACVIAGPVGSGKTDLAVEYAHEYAHEYDFVWMVRADDRATLEADLAAFRTVLARRAAAPPWTSLPARCLLIYHLVASPDDLAGVWPSSGAGHVLVTTWSAAQWTEAVPASVELGHLEPSAAVEVIRLDQLINDRELDSADLRRLPAYLNPRTSMPLGVAHLLDTVRSPGGPTLSEFLDSADSRDAPGRREIEPAHIGVSVGLIGGPGSGKTTFAAVLPIAVEQYHRRWDTEWTLAAWDRLSLEFQIDQLDAIRARRRFPAASTQWSYHSWTLRRELHQRRRARRGRPRSAQEIALQLCDIPGFVYERLPSVWASDALEPVFGANGIVYLFDTENTAPGRTLGLLNGVLARMSSEAQARGEMPRGRLPHRLAVCISKFDRQRLVELARHLGCLTSHPKTGEPWVSSEDASHLFTYLCKSLHPDYAEVDRTIRRMFDQERVRYFATSAVGFYGSKREPMDLTDCENRIERGGTSFIRGNVRPMNILEPLLWAGAA
jgi:hypothetical protein